MPPWGGTLTDETSAEALNHVHGTGVAGPAQQGRRHEAGAAEQRYGGHGLVER